MEINELELALEKIGYKLHGARNPMQVQRISNEKGELINNIIVKREKELIIEISDNQKVYFQLKDVVIHNDFLEEENPTTVCISSKDSSIYIQLYNFRI